MLQRGRMANVMEREIHLPLGRRFGRVGVMMETNFMPLFQGVKGLVVAMGIATEGEYEAALQEAIREMERGSPAGVLYIAYGQRVS
jgi:hypothetical protein